MLKGHLKDAMSQLREHGPLLRFSEVLALGVHRDTLWRLRDEGHVEQVSRGLYRLSKGPPLEHSDLVTVAKRVPGAVVCMVSALALHELTTQIPHVVEIAVKRGRRRPGFDYPPMRVYWWSAAALSEGVETRNLGGVDVRVTNAERSVADAFRYRHQLGIDLALEALHAWKEQRGSRPEALLAAARTVRMDRVIRPYLQAIL